jgi:organic radical activating enzyme
MSNGLSEANPQAAVRTRTKTVLAVDMLRCWGSILTGHSPELAVEVTRECPLRCPGCYAYAAGHVSGDNLRSVAELKGQALVDGVLALVRRYRPVHVTLVGGEPLVRYRELEDLLPRLSATGVHTQVVTSAVRPIPPTWRDVPNLNISVSVDGLPEEHDARRKPATYDRILQHIDGHQVSIHCTVTAQMRRNGYLEQFVRFWSESGRAKRIWFSLYTPQIGENSAECLTDEARRQVVGEMTRLRSRFPKLDMGPHVLEQLLAPPASPDECHFARLATCISPDLQTQVMPCQLGGAPDCSRCGCLAAAGVGGMARHRLFGFIPLTPLVAGSELIGSIPRRLRARIANLESGLRGAADADGAVGRLELKQSPAEIQNAGSKSS